ncbi:MAG: PhaM family polyhydroxyalkanoate granule multifunctional regulatory protein [Brachymonas sp.]
MTEPTSNAFGKFVPGFDFLQGLATQAVKGAASGLPAIPQMPNPANWVAPTLNVEELDKRIEELKTVQFWLDQNAKALQATITALEVQKMTLATLKGMNFNMGDVANAFKLKATETVAGAVNTALGKPSAKKSVPKKKATAAQPAKGLIDPMQWWGSLTQQFGQIASDAMKDASKKTAMDTTKNMAKAMTQTAVNTAMSTAKSAAKAVSSTAQCATQSIASNARKTTAKSSRASKTATKRTAPRR